MSFNANFSGNVEKPVHLALSGTSTTPIGGTSTDDTLVLASFAFANPSGSAVPCTLYWNDGSSDNVMWVGSVAAGETKIITDMPIKLVSGTAIKAVGANTVTVSLFYVRNIGQR